jgi:crotonobetainyl-CoA:carnitine CoA-transferase CaiB-like acyl-CoA transferase
LASALSGIRVIDVCGMGPAALVSMTMGDMGADVVKVDMPPGGGHKGVGDGLVYLPEKEDEAARMTAFGEMDRNKKKVAINMRTEAGQAVFQKLAKSSDVVIEAFRPGVMDRMNVGYAALSKINPRIIYCAVSGYGQTGPYRSYPGHDGNYAGFGGILGMTGDRVDGPPVMALNIVADMAVAYLNALAGVLLAVCAREKTGKGQMVDISMMDGVVGLLAGVPGAVEYPYTGVKPVRGDTLTSGTSPYYGVFETKDKKYLSVCPIEPRFWASMCKALGREDLVPHEFDLNPKKAEMMKDLRKIFLTKTRDEWFDILIKADVPIGKVLDIDEVFTDPQTQARQMVLDIPHPKFGKVKQVGVSIKLSDTPGSIRSLAVPASHDTEEVMSGLGYSKDEIKKLRGEGAIH